MRILHLSDSNLPDWRIEKAALSSKKKGFHVFFGGKKIVGHKSIFDKVYEIAWTSRSRNKFPIYWNNVKKQVINVIKEVRPDIIHAHNIFAAKIVKEIGDYPFVYDNHEYWSVYLRRQLETSSFIKNQKIDHNTSKYRFLIKRIAKSYFQRRYVSIWSKIEKEIIKNVPTITVSNTILKELEKFGGRIYLLPNFPLREEIIDIKEPVYHKSLSSVYAGVEPQGQVKSSHRNIDGFTNIFDDQKIGKLFVIGWMDSSRANVKYKGFLSRTRMFEEMQNHSIGLIPFKTHWSHVFISPNKAYEYAHAGLFVMSTHMFKPVFENLKENCEAFKDYEDLTHKLNYFNAHLEELYKKRLKTYEFARNNLLWENYEENIFSAYKSA